LAEEKERKGDIVNSGEKSLPTRRGGGRKGGNWGNSQKGVDRVQRQNPLGQTGGSGNRTGGNGKWKHEFRKVSIRDQMKTAKQDQKASLDLKREALHLSFPQRSGEGRLCAPQKEDRSRKGTQRILNWWPSKREKGDGPTDGPRENLKKTRKGRTQWGKGKKDYEGTEERRYEKRRGKKTIKNNPLNLELSRNKSILLEENVVKWGGIQKN